MLSFSINPKRYIDLESIGDACLYIFASKAILLFANSRSSLASKIS